MKRYATLLKSLILVTAGLVATSCVQDSDFTEKETPGTDEVVVNFNASMPGLARTLTRAADNMEFAVNKIDLLVFTQPGGTGDFVYQYSVPGRHLNQPNNTSIDFEALLKKSDDPVRLLAMANCPDSFLSGLTPGTTEADVREASFYPIDSSVLTGLPMSGATQLTSLSSTTGVIQIPLMHSYAKVTVDLDLDSSSPAFILTGVSIHRMGNGWQLFPNAGSVENETSAPMSTTPSINVAAGRVNSSMANVEAAQSFSGYATEAAAPFATEDPATVAACVIVEARFAGDTDPSYYRIEFGSQGNAENPLGQILRNYWYQFTILGVEGRGWATVEEAAQNPASSLRTSITPWSGGGNTDHYFGDNQYIKLSADSVLLDAIAYNTASMTITTSSVPFTMNSIRRPGAGIFSTAGGSSQTFSTDKMTYTMTAVPTDIAGEQKWEITVTALTSESIVDYLEMHTADDLLTIYIKIARNPPPTPPEEPPLNDPAKRKIRVYSLGTNTYGSMNLSTGSGMTAILRNTNYFGPQGTVPCAGIEFVGVGTPTGTELIELLENIDIIVTTYLYSPDAPTTQIIYDWMQEPGHVAFLTSDSPTIIDDLRVMLDPGMEWQNILYVDSPNTGTYFGYGSGFSGFVPAAATDDNVPFLNGVFGNAYYCAINDETPYDAVTLFINTTDADTRANIVPLMVSTGSAGVNNNIMLFGVDPDRRIVYTGEVLLLHRIYNWWTNTIPYDATDYINVMYSNTWAWAVEKVMTENYDVPGMTDV